MTTVRTECAECFIPVKVATAALTVTATIPSSATAGGAKRGAAFTPARTVTEDATTDGTLVMWDCPACGYADSTYADDQTRAVLA